MIEIHLGAKHTGAAKMRKLLSPVVPVHGQRIAFEDQVWHVETVTLEFEPMGTAHCLKKVIVEGWPI